MCDALPCTTRPHNTTSLHPIGATDSWRCSRDGGSFNRNSSDCERVCQGCLDRNEMSEGYAEMQEKQTQVARRLERACAITPRTRRIVEVARGEIADAMARTLKCAESPSLLPFLFFKLALALALAPLPLPPRAVA
eukprot:6180659-Pleurochrysis_carterae.AAC.2